MHCMHVHMSITRINQSFTIVGWFNMMSDVIDFNRKKQNIEYKLELNNRPLCSLNLITLSFTKLPVVIWFSSNCHHFIYFFQNLLTSPSTGPFTLQSVLCENGLNGSLFYVPFSLLFPNICSFDWVRICR